MIRGLGSFIAVTVLLSNFFTEGADISINVVKPASGSVVSQSVLVEASVSSVYELAWIRAAIDGGPQSNLVYSSQSATWTNRFSVAGLARGEHQVTVNAQDVFGATAQTAVTFLVDNPPILNVVAPLNDTVTRGDVYVEAYATDDDPSGVVVSLYDPNNYHRFRPVLRGTNSIRGVVPANAHIFEARDSAGQYALLVRRVFVETSSNLVEIASAPGKVLDFNDEHFLYAFTPDVVTNTRPFDATFALARYPAFPRLWNRLSGADTGPPPGALPRPLTGLPVPLPSFGSLASTGAMIGYTWDAPHVLMYPSIHSWQGDLFTFLGIFLGNVKVVGDNVAWINANPNTQGGLVLRSIVDPNRCITNAMATYAGFDINSDYELFYTSSNQIVRSTPTEPSDPYGNRVTTQLTFGNPGGFPQTDGNLLVYRREVAGGGREIVVQRPGGEEILATWPTLSGPDYKLNNGWVAFTKPGTSGQAQIWTRSPAGMLEQRTFFGTSSTLESLNTDGKLTFLLTNGPSGRYLSVPGALPWRVNSLLGQARWQNATLRVLIGRSVFEAHAGHLFANTLQGQGLRLTVHGPAGTIQRLQASTDLASWSDLFAFTNTAGTTSWTNSLPAERRFYRTVIE